MSIGSKIPNKMKGRLHRLCGGSTVSLGGFLAVDCTLFERKSCQEQHEELHRTTLNSRWFEALVGRSVSGAPRADHGTLSST